MMTLTIYGNPVLRRTGEPVKKFDAALARLIEEMLETMHHYKGIGLAAQQVGKALQVAVIDITEIEDRPSSMAIGGKAVDPAQYMPLYLINAKVEGTKAKESGPEGCLSFPGLRCEISRSKRVKVTTHDLTGKPFSFEAGGLLAIAIQHEMDHLAGKLFIDTLTPEERRGLKDKLAAIERGEVLPPDLEEEYEDEDDE